MQKYSGPTSCFRYRLLDEYPSEPFTDVYWIKFAAIDSARIAKKKMDDRSFFGKNLHVCYAPEYETVQDTREKLKERMDYVAKMTRGEKLLATRAADDVVSEMAQNQHLLR